MPEIPKNSTIVEATINCDVFDVNGSYFTIYAYEVPTQWSENNNFAYTWQNQPFSPSKNSYIDEKIIDAQSVNDDKIIFNITEAVVNSHKSDRETAEIMLASSSEEGVYSYYADLYTQDCTLGDKPVYSVKYEYTTGFDNSIFSYEQFDVGRAGTVFVGDYHRDVNIVRNELSYGNINLSRIYYSNYGEVGVASAIVNDDYPYGQNWQLNYSQSLTKVGEKYIYINDKGQQIEFENSQEVDGLFKIYKTKYTITSDEYTLYVPIEQNTTIANSILENSQGYMKFNSSGFLSEVNESKDSDTGIRINYVAPSSSKISSIVDNNGKKIVFTYTDDKLVNVVAKNAENEIVKLDGINDHAMSYDYLGNALISVTYADDEVVEYGFSNSQIRLVNVDDYSLRISKSNDFVTKVQEYAGTKAGDFVEYSVDDFSQLILTDSDNNKITKQFDNYGLTILMLDDKGNYLANAYDNEEKSRGVLLAQNASSNTSVNLLDNHSFEKDEKWTRFASGDLSLDGILLNTNQVYAGVKSIEITNSNVSGTGTKGYSQDVLKSAWGEAEELTLSASVFVENELVKTSDDFTENGATIFLEFKDENDAVIETKNCDYIKTTQTWQRIALTQEVPQNAVKVSVGVKLEDVSGTVYFDAIQLEQGDYASSYNYVEDADFNDEIEPHVMLVGMNFKKRLSELGQSLYSHGGTSPNEYSATTELVEAQANYKVLKKTSKYVVMKYDQLQEVAENYGNYILPDWDRYIAETSLGVKTWVYNDLLKTSGINKLWSTTNPNSWQELYYANDGSDNNGFHNLSWDKFAEFTNTQVAPDLYLRVESQRNTSTQTGSRSISYEPDDEDSYVLFEGTIFKDNSVMSSQSNENNVRDSKLNDNTFQMLGNTFNYSSNFFNVPVGAKTGDKYLVGVWAKVEDTVPNQIITDDNRAVFVSIEELGKLDINPTVQSWQYVQTVVDVERDMNYFNMIFNINHQNGSVHFDGLQVQLLERGATSQTKNPEEETDEQTNNLSMAFGSSQDETVFGSRISNGEKAIYDFSQYDDNGNVIKETNSLGNTVKYTYDEDTNLLTSQTAGGHETSNDMQINLLSNSSFETSDFDEEEELKKEALGWESSSSTTDGFANERSSEVVKSGEHSYKLSRTQAGVSSVEKVFDGVLAGEKYILSGNMKIDDIISNGYGGQIICEFLDENSDVITLTDVYNSSSQIIRTSGWHNEAFEILVPENAKRIKIKLSLDGIGTAYFDDVTLQTLLEDTQVPTNTMTSQTDYSYNAVGMLKTVSQAVSELTNAQQISSTYVYEHDKLSSIMHGDLQYNLTYDDWGNLENVKVENSDIITYDYDESQYRKLNSMIFANGDKISYAYDTDTNNITSIYLNNSETPTYEYEYNSKGELIKTIDNVANTYIEMQNSSLYIKNSLDNSLIYTYNGDIETFYSQSYEKVYNDKKDYDSLTDEEKADYDEKEKLGISDFSYTTVGNANYVTSKQSDFFGREIQNKFEFSSNVLEESFNYTDLTDIRTTDQVSNLDNLLNGELLSGYTYEYDTIGNIVKITDENSQVTQYSYDQSGALKSETIDNQTTLYSYDDKGNITSKTLLDGTVIAYEYDDQWQHQLTSYNGQTITYDEIGNPLNYMGDTLSWSGKQLESYNDNTYTYGADGLRTSKTVDGVKTEYTWLDNKLIGEKTGEETIYYLYDGGEVIGFVHNGVDTYFYVKNLQGDVTKVVDETGTVVAEYTYNAWGEITSQSGIMAETNPIRYRTYYYDSEISLYYCQQRYYNAELGRWLSADILFDNRHINGVNLYAYCLNNPVSFVDYEGMKPIFYNDEYLRVYNLNYNNHLYMGESAAVAIGNIAAIWFSLLIYGEWASIAVNKFIEPNTDIFEFSYNYVNTLIDHFPFLSTDIKEDYFNSSGDADEDWVVLQLLFAYGSDEGIRIFAEDNLFSLQINYWIQYLSLTNANTSTGEVAMDGEWDAVLTDVLMYATLGTTSIDDYISAGSELSDFLNQKYDVFLKFLKQYL